MSAWNWWAAALENPKEIGKRLSISVDSPEQGFYRSRFKNQPWEPVAIWKDGEDWVALRSGKPVDAAEIWNYCCRYPISSEAYDRAVNGDGWADADPTVAAALAGPGHNVGGISDYETLRDEIASAEAGIDRYHGISDDEQASMAQSLRARLNELAGQADKLRELEKRPHLEASKAVDAQWMPLVKGAKANADMLRREIEAFKTHQLALRREEERQRAEREAAEKATVGGASVPVPPPLPPVDSTLKGAYGRAATVRSKAIVTGITDLYALVDHLKNTHWDEMYGFLLGLAQKDANTGLTVPGVTTEERAVIS